MSLTIKPDPIQVLLEAASEVYPEIDVDIRYDCGLVARNEAACAITSNQVGENSVILINPELSVYGVVEALADRLALIFNIKSKPVLPDHTPIVKAINMRYREKLELLDDLHSVKQL